MSRYERYNQKYGFSWGIDHAFGGFIQVWKLNPKYPPDHFMNQPDSDNIIVDEDGLTTVQMTERLEELQKEYDSI